MRLNGWHQNNPNAAPGHPDDGYAALKALEEVRLVRATLEVAERNAVETARRHGRTWAQIAAALGMATVDAKDRWQERISTARTSGAMGSG